MQLHDLFEGNEQAYNWHSEPEQRSMDATRQARLYREREPKGSEAIDARIRARYDQLDQYNQSGKFWLKQKDTQEHISDAMIGKAAATAAAVELLKQRPELKGNLVITAYGPGESQGVAEGDYPDGSSVKTPGADEWKQQYQQAVMAVKNAKTQQEYEAASDRAGRIKDLLASKGIQVGPVLGEHGVAEANIQPTSAKSRSHIGNLSNPTTNSVVHPSSGKEIGLITKQPNGEYYAHPSSTALAHSQGATFASQDEAHQFIRNAHAKAVKNGTLSNKWLKSQPLPQFAKEQGMAEGAGNIGSAIKSLYRKIYRAGDDEIEYFYNASPIFAQYWDEYEGDLDSIIAEVDPEELAVIKAELESYAQDANLAEAPGAETLSHNQSTVSKNLNSLDLGEGDISQLEKDVAAAPVAPIANMEADEKIGGRHDPDDFDAMVGRLKKLAGAGPMKTVYDPNKRVYRNVPTAQQPAQQPKK